MTFYIEVSEMRRYSAQIEARSPEEAKDRALRLAEMGELPCDVLDRDAIAIEAFWKAA